MSLQVVRGYKETDADYIDCHNGEVWCPGSKEQYGHSRQHLDALQCSSCRFDRRSGIGDGSTSTPQIGSQTAIVDVEDCLWQEVRKNENNQRVDQRLKTVVRWLTERML